MKRYLELSDEGNMSSLRIVDEKGDRLYEMPEGYFSYELVFGKDEEGFVSVTGISEIKLLLYESIGATIANEFVRLGYYDKHDENDRISESFRYLTYYIDGLVRPDNFDDGYFNYVRKTGISDIEKFVLADRGKHTKIGSIDEIIGHIISRLNNPPKEERRPKRTLDKDVFMRTIKASLERPPVRDVVRLFRDEKEVFDLISYKGDVDMHPGSLYSSPTDYYYVRMGLKHPKEYKLKRHYW